MRIYYYYIYVSNLYLLKLVIGEKIYDIYIYIYIYIYSYNLDR